MAASEQVAVLPLNISRGLTDKLVEKRKGAALELEKMVKEAISKNDYNLVKDIIGCLKDDFTLSLNPNGRKGGVVGLAAIAIALGRPSIGMNLPELVDPVLVCFDDQDARVRYYACESLYNISKVARSAVLVFFNKIFDGLCKLSCDPDSNVRYGAELLDRLMKDIVSENPHFDVDNFITLLMDRMYTNSTFARQFIVSWIQFLDSVPEIHMHEHVPEFIDGLFLILGDDSTQIKKTTEDTLGELLREIHSHPKSVRYEDMANIVSAHCQSNDKIIQLIALRWMNAFLELSGRRMLPFTANVLIAVLPCLALESDKNDIRQVAIKVNDRLKNLIIEEDDEDIATDVTDEVQVNLLSGSPSKQFRDRSDQIVAKDGKPDSKSDIKPGSKSTDSQQTAQEDVCKIADEGEAGDKEVSAAPDKHHFPLLNVLAVLIGHMKFTSFETRIGTLNWLLWLHSKLPKRIYRQAGKLFPQLQEMLTDISERVLKLALRVIATLSMSEGSLEPADRDKGSLVGKFDRLQVNDPSNGVKKFITLNKYFRLFLTELISMLNTDRILLENKGSAIIRYLCVYLDPKAVYCTLADIISVEDDFTFASLLVRELNTILFSSVELFQLRVQLQSMQGHDSWVLFKTLYDSWCHNPIATVALCLLSQNYKHAANIVSRFGEIEITAEVLHETDKLVQLIESPVFTSLRLHLLTPQQYPHLVQTLFGLLMLLPQTKAYESLQKRLSAVPIINSLNTDIKKKPMRSVPKDIDFDKLLQHFLNIQRRHYETRHTQVQKQLTKILFEATTTTV